jgi:hypothetical protein
MRKRWLLLARLQRATFPSLPGNPLGATLAAGDEVDGGRAAVLGVAVAGVPSHVAAHDAVLASETHVVTQCDEPHLTLTRQKEEREGSVTQWTSVRHWLCEHIYSVSLKYSGWRHKKKLGMHLEI